MSERIIASRKGLLKGLPARPLGKAEEEGGCGVVGFSSNAPVRGRHIFEPSIQMHNRGNGKGGGVAAACFIPEQLGVDAHTIRNSYILQIALLDPTAESEVEKTCITPYLRIDHKTKLEPSADYIDLGLTVKPPDIIRYFVRVKAEELSMFAEENALEDLPSRKVEDEFIYRNTFRLNQKFYASLGEKRAFVLSHARNLMIFKIVGYAEQVVKYYGLEDLRANIWIAHQRYPTKGRVWHPAGSHPFIGMNEALVHNGDFANYYSVSQYLRQHNIVSQFLTDTEVSVLLFDLLTRVYEYPLEYVIEAMAPTTELDFDRLPEEKKRIYRAIQAIHIHGSPDGPWFFIIARSDPDTDTYQLLGITDTAMLRPQVFALQEGDVSIGLIASEKQAIDATLHSLSTEDKRFRLVADRYWNARGGSHTDGGAFTFTVTHNNGSCRLFYADKFGRPISSPPGDWRVDLSVEPVPPRNADELKELIPKISEEKNHDEIFNRISSLFTQWDFETLRWFVKEIQKISSQSDDLLEWGIELLTMFLDRRYSCGRKRRSVVLQIIQNAIAGILDSIPLISHKGPGRYRRIDWDTRSMLRAPENEESRLVIFSRGFPAEGGECDSRLAVKAYQLEWRQFIVYGLKGQRFTGCGFGPETDNVRIDV
ncbi:MAG: glutamate synthase, partial [bacterium]